MEFSQEPEMEQSAEHFQLKVLLAQAQVLQSQAVALTNSLESLTVVRAKVEMLNDWHHTVDRRLDTLKERTLWLLLIAGATGLLGAPEKVKPIFDWLITYWR